jgi:hypothetical protein
MQRFAIPHHADVRRMASNSDKVPLLQQHEEERGSLSNGIATWTNLLTSCKVVSGMPSTESSCQAVKKASKPQKQAVYGDEVLKSRQRQSTQTLAQN